MKCPECKKETISGKTTLIFQHKGIAIEVKEIPAQLCPSCKEAFIDGPISEYVDELVKEVGRIHMPPEVLVKRGIQVKEVAMVI